MESKKKVLLIGAADFAGSCYRTTQAINRIGRIEAHHITLHDHPNKHSFEIMMPLLHASIDVINEWENTPTWYEAKRLIYEADLIHCWNNEGEDFATWTHGKFDVPQDKVKSYSFTGTGYRIEHSEVNARMKNRPGHKVVVAHPTLRYPNEFDAEFIPHPIDVKELIPLPIEERIANSIGHYLPRHANTTVRADLNVLKYFLNKNHPEWTFPLNGTVSHAEHLQRLAKCMFYFEYMDQKLGYWGTSTLEASALGVPVFTAYTSKCQKLSMGRVGNPPGVIVLTPGNIEKVLKETLNSDNYWAIVEKTRKWVETYHSYEAVGELYTQFFEGIVND